MSDDMVRMLGSDGHRYVRWAAIPGSMLLLALTSCGGSSPSSKVDAGRDAPMTACTPGQSIACVGPAGCAGGQVCKADGSGYEACDCGSGGRGGVGGSVGGASGGGGGPSAGAGGRGGGGAAPAGAGGGGASGASGSGGTTAGGGGGGTSGTSGSGGNSAGAGRGGASGASGSGGTSAGAGGGGGGGASGSGGTSAGAGGGGASGASGGGGIAGVGGAGGNTTCDPLAAPGQQGCSAGEKCTWIRVADTPTPLGKIGCAPAGAVGIGQTCTNGAVGATTGYDDCVAGAICIGAMCQDICGFDGSAKAACGTGEACTRYADLFANGQDDPVAGACVPSCDPLTQTVEVPGGGTTTCGAGKGCYVLASTV